MRKTLNLIIVILFCFASGACNSGKNTEDPVNKSKEKIHVYKNLIEDFELAEKITPTREIDLTKKNIREHLGKGWSNPEENHRWALGPESELYFFSAGDSDIDLKLDCRPFIYDKNVTQSIEVYLNSKYISKIVMQPNSNPYRITLPYQEIKNGKNHLIFKYRYAERPSDHYDSSDTRTLSVDFKRIQFIEQAFQNSNFTVSKIQNKIIQQPRTLMNYFYRLHADCHLEVEVDEMSDNTSANIEIRSDNNDYLQAKLNHTGSKKISLSRFSGKFVKFSFSVDITSGKRSFGRISDIESVSWSKIAISEPLKEPKDSLVAGEDVALKQFRDQIRDLDIIYIVFDAFNAKHSSLYGYERKTTPFIDKLAEKSIVFDNFYANHPYTLASTGTLLTSKYSYEHGLILETNRLDRILPTLPEILSDNQILSFLITSHGYFSKEWGLSRGFTKVFFDEKINKALESIYNSESDKRKKFIYLHLMPPHEPYNPPKKYRIFTNSSYTPIETDPATLDKIETGEIKATESHLEYIKAMYDANVLYADHIAKKIFEFLQKNNIHKKVVIMITSDHGEAFMEHGYTTHNTTIYDEMIHIPLIITFPENVNAIGKRVQHMASIIDIAPTILDILGIRSEDMFRGESLLPLIYGYKGKGYIYAETLLTGQRGIRDLTYKFISTLSGKELYNLTADPSEMENLFEYEPVISGCFMQKLKLYQSKRERKSKKNQVDLKALDEKTVKQLKELGYIK